jgi:hypothetical protein
MPLLDAIVSVMYTKPTLEPIKDMARFFVKLDLMLEVPRHTCVT